MGKERKNKMMMMMVMMVVMVMMMMMMMMRMMMRMMLIPCFLCFWLGRDAQLSLGWEPPMQPPQSCTNEKVCAKCWSERRDPRRNPSG